MFMPGVWILWSNSNSSYHSCFNPECNTKRTFIDSLCIALGPEREVLELWHSYYIKRPLWNYILICTLMEENWRIFGVQCFHCHVLYDGFSAVHNWWTRRYFLTTRFLLQMSLPEIQFDWSFELLATISTNHKPDRSFFYVGIFLDCLLSFRKRVKKLIKSF